MKNKFNYKLFVNVCLWSIVGCLVSIFALAYLFKTEITINLLLTGPLCILVSYIITNHISLYHSHLLPEQQVIEEENDKIDINNEEFFNDLHRITSEIHEITKNTSKVIQDIIHNPHK